MMLVTRAGPGSECLCFIWLYMVLNVTTITSIVRLVTQIYMLGCAINDHHMSWEGHSSIRPELQNVTDMADISMKNI